VIPLGKKSVAACGRWAGGGPEVYREARISFLENGWRRVRGEGFAKRRDIEMSVIGAKKAISSLKVYEK